MKGPGPHHSAGTGLAQKERERESSALRSFFRGHARRISKGRVGIPGVLHQMAKLLPWDL